jgi:hypothetical protein
MLHAFVGDDLNIVRETVRRPMKAYLASSLSLVKNVATLWSAYKRRPDGSVAGTDVELNSLSDEELDGLLDFSFERYFETSGLFGTPETCLEFVRRLCGIGVDEIACLIDFGVESETVLSHLEHLNRLRILAEQDVAVKVNDRVPATGTETIGTLILRHRATHLQCTPSLARMILADDESRAALRMLRVILVGGEALPSALAHELREATDATILNMYGPTETTIWSSVYVVSGDENAVPIGRPIANTQFYILDEHFRPVPSGTIGELYIGGDGVARGYYERPELTAERFLKNPFVEDDAARVYRTGDLARFRSDGVVEFLGRSDQQVKIRGYRIELGEIESVLLKHPEIREAVVIVREDTPGDQRLISYYTCRSSVVLTEEELRKLLRESLPDYMVPSRFIALERFPQTPNRKVDRKALPPPNDVAMCSSSLPDSLASGIDDVEGKVMHVWKQLLGIAEVGRDQNFFDIGGHSLLAVQAHRRFKEIFHKTILITDLFQHPTVKSFAAFVRQDGNGKEMDESQQRGTSRRELLMERRSQRRPIGN